MKKQLLLPLSVLSLSFSSASFAAEHNDPDTNDLLGLGSGAAAGAMIGGPVGAIIGSIVGVLIADDINDENKLAKASQELATSQQYLSRRDSQLAALSAQYETLQHEQQQIASEVEALIQDIESQVLFRTASHQIEPHFKSQLNLVAQGLKDNPELHVTLSGYADSRGDDSYNQALSQQRALSVKRYLLDLGVDEQQVKTASFGETQAASDKANYEDHFFDRRVLVQVVQESQSMTASTH